MGKRAWKVSRIDFVAVERLEGSVEAFSFACGFGGGGKVEERVRRKACEVGSGVDVGGDIQSLGAKKCSIFPPFLTSPAVRSIISQHVSIKALMHLLMEAGFSFTNVEGLRVDPSAPSSVRDTRVYKPLLLVK